MKERRGSEHASEGARDGATGLVASPAPVAPRVQKKCDCGASPVGDSGSCAECDKKRVSRKAAPELSAPSAAAPDGGDVLAGLGSGEPFGGAARDRMERALGHDFRSIRVHADAAADEAARDLGAHAFAVGEHVGFASGRYAPGTPAGDALMAHELAHVMQQAGGAAGPSVADSVLENDADRAALGAMAALYAGADPASAPSQQATRGHLSLGRCGGQQAAPEHQMTHDEAMVARATSLLPIVREEIAELQAREDTRVIGLMRRQQIEDPLAAATGRPALEAANLAGLNRAPLRVELADGVVRFHVRFQVRFENPSDSGQLATIRDTVQRAADTVWTAPEGDAMHGRRFEMQTSVEAEGGTRDSNFWLVVLRASDTGPVTHPGCSLADPRPVVAAVTDSTCDGGVMNIPPNGVGDAGLIGHEMLHLFGLVDRYLMTTSLPPPSTAPRPPGSAPPPPPRPIVNTIAMRTPGRPDPLGAERGTILPEDLAFIFQNLGVFAQDEREFVRRSRTGRDLGMLIRLENWCTETIRLGRDPDSLIRYRENFNDRMIRTGEDN